MTPLVPARRHYADDETPPEIMPIPELAYVLALARDLAWSSHCNVIGLRYVERREAHARLRGALAAYDRARGAFRLTGKSPVHVIADVRFREGRVACRCGREVQDEGNPEQVKLAYGVHRISVGLASVIRPVSVNRAFNGAQPGAWMAEHRR